jgi:hypothetical protein
VQLVHVASGDSLDRFRAIVEAIRGPRAHLASLLAHAYVIQIDAQKLRLGFEPGHFAASQVTQPQELAVLEGEARAQLGPAVEVSIETNVRPMNAGTTLASLDREKHAAARAAQRREVEEHPVVKKIVSLFGAEIRDIKIPDSD